MNDPFVMISLFRETINKKPPYKEEAFGLVCVLEIREVFDHFLI